MNTSTSAEALIQRQLDAYNAHDIDALMTTYADDVQHFEFTSTLVASGAAQVRERLSVRLQEPNLHAQLPGRIAMDNLVIDHERVTRDFPEGLGTIELIAGARGVARSGDLPFGLGRQPRTGPAGKGIGFVKADMSDRRRRIDGAAARQGEAGPAVIAVLPAQRRRDRFVLEPGPAVRQPEPRGAITAGGDECSPIGVGDERLRQCERPQQHVMRRAFAIKTESRAIMTDARDAARVRRPAGNGSGGGGRQGKQRRFKGIGGE